MILSPHDPLAIATTVAIQTGDVPALTELLRANPDLATCRLGDPTVGKSRTLLHVATDWPGHFPNGAATVAALVAAGADVNARFTGPHTEAPLHWAASSDDVEVLDALLDAGADIDADGAVIAGSTPLADARAFLQWNAARRLIARGATVQLQDAATLGLLDRVADFYATDPAPSRLDTSRAFWGACHGGQRHIAEYLLARGADLNWVADWEPMTPLDIARRNKDTELTTWLESVGAISATELP